MPHACECVLCNVLGYAHYSRCWRAVNTRTPPGSPRTAFCALRAAAPMRSDYLTVTEAPAPSRAALAFSAASLLTFSRTVFGAPSTRSLASLRPRLVSVRTSLMTWIFLSPAASRTTSNSSCSSAASASAAPAPAGAATPATATGAAALTSNVSSKAFTNSDSSRRVISLNASSRSALLSFAMIVSLRSLVLSLCLGVARFRAGLGRGAGLDLGAQRVCEQRHLRGQRVERRRRVRHRRLHRAGQLGQQHLARFEVGQLADFRRGQRLAVEHATLDHEQRVRLGEVEQALGGLRHVPADERDRGRPRQQRRELVTPARLGSRQLRERVLHDRKRGVAREGAAQLLQLCHGQPAVLGEHRAA